MTRNSANGVLRINETKRRDSLDAVLETNLMVSKTLVGRADERCVHRGIKVCGIVL